MTEQEWIQIIASFAGAVGFALLFGLHGWQLPVTALGSGLTWGLCILGQHLGWNVFCSVFAASLFGSLYSVCMSRLLKVPKTGMFISVLIALIPGNGLYQTMRYVVDGKSDAFIACGLETLITSFAIASGMVVVLVIDTAVRRARTARISGK